MAIPSISLAYRRSALMTATKVTTKPPSPEILQAMGPSLACGRRSGCRDSLRQFADQGGLLARHAIRSGVGDRERAVDGRPVDRELQRHGRLLRAHA